MTALLALIIALIRVTNQGYEAQRVPGSPANITCITRSGGETLIGTGAEGLWALREGKMERIEGVPEGARVTTIGRVHGRALIGTYKDSQNPYVSSGEGTWALIDGERKLRSVEGLPRIANANCFEQAGDQALIGTYGHGLWALPDGKLTAQRWAGPPERDPIFRMFAFDGQVLVATSLHGVWVLRKGGRELVKISDPSDDDGLFSPLCFARQAGRTLVGTSCFGMWTIPDGMTKPAKLLGVPPGDVVRCALTVGNQTYIGSLGGLFSLRLGASKAVAVPGLTGRKGVTCLTRAGSVVYVGTESHGLLMIRDGESALRPVSGLPAGYQADKFAVSGKDVVVNGAYVVDATSGVATPITGIPEGERVTTIATVGDEVLIGTFRGLWRMSRKLGRWPTSYLPGKRIRLS